MKENNEAKHTPGPWVSGPALVGGCIPVNQQIAGDRMQVARVNGTKGEQEANAKLIAAAPDLAGAASYVLAMAEAQGWEPMAQDALRAALKKAGY